VWRSIVHPQTSSNLKPLKKISKPEKRIKGIFKKKFSYKTRSNVSLKFFSCPLDPFSINQLLNTLG
jgi:hypothetical protein